MRRNRLRSASNAKPASRRPKVVGSAWTPWVRPTQSVSACSRGREPRARRGRRGRPATIDLPGLAQLDRQGGVEHVRGGEPVVEPAPLLADRLRDHVDEGRDVVAGGPLALLDRLDRERGALAAGLRGLLRDRALRGPGVGRGQLDLQPGVHAALLGPDGADLLAGVAGDHVLILTSAAGTYALMIRTASNPAFLAPSIATHADRHAGGHLHCREQRVEAAEVLARDRHPDHRQVALRGGEARQRRRHPGAGDDHLQPAHAGVGAVVARLLGLAVRAQHPHLVADPRLVERLAGGLHLRLVVLRAHDDPDQRRVHLDLLERLLDLGQRSRRPCAVGPFLWFGRLHLFLSVGLPGISRPPRARPRGRRCRCASACRRS